MKLQNNLKRVSLIFYFSSFSFLLFAQDATNTTGSPDKLYSFKYDKKLSECDADGSNTRDPQIVPRGTYFSITSVTPSGYVITINLFKYKKGMTNDQRAVVLKNRKNFNYDSFPQNSGDSLGVPYLSDGTDNRKRFFISNTDFTTFAVEKPEFISLDYGTLIEPFKFRSNPSIFTTNLSLGAIIGFQKSFPRGSNYNYGLYAGLSLSSITLDSFSTKGTVLVNSDRPALTPSINFLIGYKSINVTVGIGWDIINQTSPIEKSWVYQGKPWIGLGIGLKLFTPNSANTTPAPAAGSTQTKSFL